MRYRSYGLNLVVRYLQIRIFKRHKLSLSYDTNSHNSESILVREANTIIKWTPGHVWELFKMRVADKIFLVYNSLNFIKKFLKSKSVC